MHINSSWPCHTRIRKSLCHHWLRYRLYDDWIIIALLISLLLSPSSLHYVYYFYYVYFIYFISEHTSDAIYHLRFSLFVERWNELMSETAAMMAVFSIPYHGWILIWRRDYHSEDLHHAHYWKLPFMKIYFHYIVLLFISYTFMHSGAGSFLYTMYIFHVIFSYLWLSKVPVNERRRYVRDVTESLFSQRPRCVDLHSFYMMFNSFIFHIFGACHTCTITLIRSKCFIVTITCQCGLLWCVQAFYNCSQSKLINQGLDSMNNGTKFFMET